MSRRAMIALRRLADPRLRPAWYGIAAAAVLAAIVILHGLIIAALSWFLHPWRFALLLAAAAIIIAWALGLFEWHSDRGIRVSTAERAERIRDSREAAQRAWDEFEAHEAARPRAVAAPRPHPADAETDLLAARARADARAEAAADAAFAHSAMWQPRGSEAGTPMAAAVAARYQPHREPLISDEDVTGWIPEEHGASCACRLCAGRRVPAAVEVTGSPAGKHERPRAYLVHSGPEPYCMTCGSHEHWTRDHQGPDPLVTQMVADRAASRARHAIDDDLRAAGFRVYDDEDDAVQSMWTRAMGRAAAAIEEARKP